MQFGVSESIAHWGKYRPASIAIYHNGQVTSFQKLNSLVNSLCCEIDKSDFCFDRIAIAVHSKADFLISLLAILRSGKSAVLLNMGLPDEAIHINIQDAKVTCLIHDECNQRLCDFISSTNNKRILNVNKIMENHTSIPKIPVNFAVRGPGDEWGVLYSSGTTGTPKGIERDHNSIVTELLGWSIELGLSSQTEFYIGRPIYYTGGLVLALSTLIMSGSIILNDFNDDNDPNEVWTDYQNIFAHLSPKWAFFVPDQIRAFIQIIENKNVSLKMADMILVMGSAISGEEKIKAKRLLGSGIVESWGNSESLGTITEPDDIEKRPDSIGRPFLTDELFIVDNNCNQVGPGQYGRIAGSEEAGFSEYCNRPEATKCAKQKNLIISEDIGYIDDEGYFYVCGRQQDCVLINGDTLFIPDIEQKIRQHDNIKECAIITNSPDETLVELIAAIVPMSKSKMEKSQFILELNSLLETNEQLADIALMDTLPHVPSGKIDKVTIKKLIKQLQ